MDDDSNLELGNSASGGSKARDGFTIRKAGDGDRRDIVRLLTGMAIKDADKRYEWIYRSNPHGDALTWLAIEDATGEAVACTSIFPRKVAIDGVEVLGSVGGDCFVEPRVRRRGLALALHRQSLGDMRRYGVDFMYGHPTENNMGALLKAGSNRVMDIQWWGFPLSPGAIWHLTPSKRSLSRLGGMLVELPAIVRRRARRANHRRVALEQVAGFDGEFDRLFARGAGKHRIFCLRDRAYLAWRYLEAPSDQQIPLAVRRDGRLVGFVAVDAAAGRAVIIDLFIDDPGLDEPGVDEPSLTAETLHRVFDAMKSRGCRLVNIALGEADPLTPLIAGAGFLKASTAGFQVAAAGSPRRDTLLSAAAWHFMMADNDIDAITR